MIPRSTLATRIALAAILPISLPFALSAHAVDDDIEAVGSGYIKVGDSVLTTGLDECTRSGSFADDAAIDACEGVDAAAPDAEPAVEVAEKAPAVTPQKAIIDSREISKFAFFANDSATLDGDSEAALQDLFAKLEEYKGITAISVTGHTSARGADDYNQALSERRAQAVADVLAIRYPDAKMTVAGMGESQPVANNDTPEGAARNRRVEIEVSASRMMFE